MPGFSIYYGSLLTEAQITIKLQKYKKTKTVVENTKKYPLSEETKKYVVRPDTAIVFNLSYDEIMEFTSRSGTHKVVRTHDVNIRILRAPVSLIFLIEHVKGVRNIDVVQRISRILYGSNAVKKVKISSAAIKGIESVDYRKISAEGFSHLTDRDSLVMAYGNLAIRKGDGTEEFSDVHLQYKNKDKGFSRFKSMSTGSEVFISAKAASLSLRGPRLNLKQVEDYIRENLLPKL